MENRVGNADLVKFIAALLIMAHHIYHMGISGYRFYDSWVYVEFFTLVTGYFTAKHFSKKTTVNKSKEAVQYTIKKFLPLIPYTVAVSALAWITNAISGVIYDGWTWKLVVENFLGDFAFDMLLIPDGQTLHFVTPLWYISAMIMGFPIFILIVQLKNRYTKIIICIFIPIIYFGKIGITGTIGFPHDIFRVVCGMMLGVIIFEISRIFITEIQKIPKTCLTIIEIMCIIYPIYGCYTNMAAAGYTVFRLYVLCFFVSLLICLPGFSYTVKIRGWLFNYLGKLSVPMFIFHWYVGTLVDIFSKFMILDNQMKIIIYYIGTFIFSMIAMAIVDQWKWFQNKIKQPIELID